MYEISYIINYHRSFDWVHVFSVPVISTYIQCACILILIITTTTTLLVHPSYCARLLLQNLCQHIATLASCQRANTHSSSRHPFLPSSLPYKLDWLLTLTKQLLPSKTLLPLPTPFGPSARRRNSRPLTSFPLPSLALVPS